MKFQYTIHSQLKPKKDLEIFNNSTLNRIGDGIWLMSSSSLGEVIVDRRRLMCDQAMPRERVADRRRLRCDSAIARERDTIIFAKSLASHDSSVHFALQYLKMHHRLKYLNVT